jgi:signal transduction histidine kinase/CheY-like chemotaxis protein
MNALIVVALLTAAAGAFGGGFWYSQYRSRSRWIPANERNTMESELEGLRDEIWELKEQEAAREKAEAANEAKTRFLATVSHEMRTPLNGILGMAELLSRPDLSAEQKSYVDAIGTSGKALASLIDEILDFAKIEAGRIELLAEPFNPISLVEGVAELLAPRAQGKGLEIATVMAPDLPQGLIGDEARLRQVLLNLAGNAVKFTISGGVGIRASWRQPGLLRIEISDSGPGIPPHQQSIIFDEFEQADGSSSRRHEGTGLGLAISRRIVESMGGQLKLEQSSEKGSVFAFELPLTPVSASRPGKTEQLDLAGRQVLIVASSPFEAPYMGERLDAAGAAVLRAHDEAEALDMLSRTANFDIVIVDCALGEEASQRIATAAREAGVARALVLFSPFERRTVGQHTMREFDGWLVKPVRAASLLERLTGKPVMTEPSAAVTSAGGEADPPLELPSTPSPFQALVAEDNDINALIAYKHLERMGATVTRARDGQEAMQTFSHTLTGAIPKFDLILMDIRMPLMDGIEATRRIRALEKDAGRTPIRIIALTANAFEEDRQACLEAGIDQFLTKPVDFEGLSRAVLPVDQSSQTA